MNNRLSPSLWVVFFLLPAWLMCTQEAGAIPAFSRKYQTSCITCHAPFPRLNALGEAIRLNGFKMPDGDELYIKEEPVVLGVKAYETVFPHAVWPSDIPGLPPVSIRAIADADVDIGGTQESGTEFKMPQEVAILSAGSFGENISFLAEIEFEEEDDKIETGIDAWLMLEDLFKSTIGANHLNLKAGSVGMQEIALPNNRGHNRITRQNYLAEEELNLQTEPGFEINGFGRSWRYHVGVVDADDQNSEKDFYLAFALKLGGLGYDGSGAKGEGEALTTEPSAYWLDDSIRLGFFAFRSYLGEEAEAFDRIGADFRVNFRDLSLGGGFIRGENDLTGLDKDIWFVEAEYFVLPWMVPYVRYEELSVDGADKEDKARFVAGSAFLVRANIRLNTEARLHTENESTEAAGGDKNDDDRLFLRVDWAF